MDATNQSLEIQKHIRNRIENNVNLPLPGNIDLFFWGVEKDINIYLHILIQYCTSIGKEGSRYAYERIIIVHKDIEIKKIEEYFIPIITDQIKIEFLIPAHFEISELEKIINNVKNAFIIILNTENYLCLKHSPKLIDKLKGRKLTDFELKYLNVTDNVLYLKDTIGSNFLLFDTQLYSTELDFLDILNEVDELSICGFTNELVNRELMDISTIQALIKEKSIPNILKYIESLDSNYDRDFIKLQVYSELMDEKGYFSNEIDKLFETMDKKSLSMQHYLKLAEISKKKYTLETTIDLLKKALDLTNEYFYLVKIADFSEGLRYDFQLEVIKKIKSLFPNSPKIKIHYLNEIIDDQDYDTAYAFALENELSKDLTNFLYYLKNNFKEIDNNPYLFFTEGLRVNFTYKYLISLFKITKEHLIYHRNYSTLYQIIIVSKNHLKDSIVYLELVALSKIILSKLHRDDKNNEDFQILLSILDFIFDIKNTSEQSLTHIKDQLVELILYSNNYGYGFVVIVNYIYAKFINNHFILNGMDEVDRSGISTSIYILKKKHESIMEAMSLEGVWIVGEYHSFDDDIIPSQKTVDDLIRLQFHGMLDSLKDSSKEPNEELESFNYSLLLIHNLARYSSFKNSDFHFLRLALSTMANKQHHQKIRDYLQYFFFLPKTFERKKLGLLCYADVSHRMNNKDEALTCLALSMDDNKITANSYYLMGILTVRLFRDLDFHDKALEILEILENNIRRFDDRLYNSIQSEVQFNKLSIQFKLCLRGLHFDTDELNKLLRQIIELYESEKKLNNDIKPLLTLAVQAYKILQQKGSLTQEFDQFFSSIKDNNYNIPSFLLSMLHDDFDLIFDLYLKQIGSHAENLIEDLTYLKILAQSYLNQIENKEQNNLLFCLEVLAESSIKDSRSHKVDAQIKPFNSIEEYICCIETLRSDTDIVYLCLNQFKQLITAQITESEAKIEQNINFNIHAFFEWKKKFPKGYGDYDVNKTPNLFYDSIEELGLNIELKRHTVFVFDTQLHSLIPNIFLYDDTFIGTKNSVSVAPSLTWLNHIVHLDKPDDQKILKSWISNADSEGYTLKTIIDIYSEDNVLENYNIELDTSHYLPKGLENSKLVMITAHGGTTVTSNYFSSISDEGSLEVHYQEFAKRLRNCGVVVLFVCNAGRFNNHPYLSTTISLQKELLKNGCETIIASPWPLDAMMTPRWFGCFLNKWIDESLTVEEAVYQTNMHFYENDFNPAKYLALSVFGNPFKKYL
jgi:hypothetical protein